MCDAGEGIHWSPANNFLFVFHLTAVEISLGRHKVLKVIGCALYLSLSSYDVEHVLGVIKNMSDILKRWMREYRRTASRTHGVARIPD